MHSVTSLCKAYPNEDTARRAVDALQAAGVGRRDIQLLTGNPLHDTRHEPVGTFAGSVGPSGPVGTFGGRVVLRGGGSGSFAGDSSQQRRGSFGDADRVVITTYQDRAQRFRITGRRGLRRLLEQLWLDGNTVRRVLDEVAAGRAIVLVDAAEITPGGTAAQLDELARAA